MASELMLLDSASLYFRAYFGVPETVRAPDGTPVNAVRGLLDFIARLVSTRHPARLVACLDADWRPQFRVDALPSYKAHRVGTGAAGEDTPASLDTQIPIIMDVLSALGIATLGVPGFEADDVIGTLAHREPADVDVVTGDRDLFQLVDDARGVRVLYTVARGVGNILAVDDAEIMERYGIHAAQYADFATLRGDPSDGLPGVAGIGDKTAASLLRSYGDIAGILAAAADLRSLMPQAQRKRLMAARDYLAVAPDVVRVRLDVPVPAIDDALPREPRDPTALAALDERWGLTSALRRAQEALAAG